MLAPTIEIESFQGSQEIHLESRLLKEQRLFLYGEITQDSANILVQQLIWMEAESNPDPIKLYINSPGGEITSGLLIYDVLQAIPKDIEMYCTGMAASMAAVILASGKKGHRHILPHSYTMIHEPQISSIGGSATSVKHLFESIMNKKTLVNEILAKHVGKTLEEINKATSYDNYMTAEESVMFGICDDVTTRIF